MISPVIARPTSAQMNRFMPVNFAPSMAPNPPNIQLMTPATSAADSTAVVISPLYSAAMMPLPLPNRTKKLPTTEARMQTPQITSGKSNIVSCSGPVKNAAASSMVPTSVTA